MRCCQQGPVTTETTRPQTSGNEILQNHIHQWYPLKATSTFRILQRVGLWYCRVWCKHDKYDKIIRLLRNKLRSNDISRDFIFQAALGRIGYIYYYEPQAPSYPPLLKVKHKWSDFYEDNARHFRNTTMYSRERSFYIIGGESDGEFVPKMANILNLTKLSWFNTWFEQIKCTSYIYWYVWLDKLNSKQYPQGYTIAPKTTHPIYVPNLCHISYLCSISKRNTMLKEYCHWTVLGTFGKTYLFCLNFAISVL